VAKQCIDCGRKVGFFSSRKVKGQGPYCWECSAKRKNLANLSDEPLTDAQIVAFQATRADGVERMTIHFRCPVCGKTFAATPNETAVQTASDWLKDGAFTTTCSCGRELRMAAGDSKMIAALKTVVSRKAGVTYVA
jgi:hypothetical protein